MAMIYVVVNRTTKSGAEFRMYLMNQLFSFFKQKKFGMASYPILEEGHKSLVRSFVARDEAVPGSRVEFLCGETNSGYFHMPHVAPPHKSGDMHVSITIIQNNVLSMCTPYLVMKQLIGPIDNMSEAEHSQLVDESIIRLVHQPHMTVNRPFFYKDFTKPLPIVIYANLNFLLPYPHDPLCDEHAAPAKAYPDLPIVEANSIPEIIAMALQTVRDEMMMTRRAGEKAGYGKVNSILSPDPMCPCEPPGGPRVMLQR